MQAADQDLEGLEISCVCDAALRVDLFCLGWGMYGFSEGGSLCSVVGGRGESHAARRLSAGCNRWCIFAFAKKILIERFGQF